MGDELGSFANEAINTLYKMEIEEQKESLDEEKINKKIIFIEYVSILVITLCLIVSTFLAFEEKSASATGLAVDSLLDILSFLIILWRYLGDKEKSEKREKNALFVLGFLFLVSSAIVLFNSIYNLVLRVKLESSIFFIFINIIQGLIFLGIGGYKYYLSKKTRLGHSLLSDSINSSISAFDCISMSISMSIYISDRNIWYFDSIFGIIMGIFIFFYGCHLFYQTLCKNKL
jgi:divalent metal cation (Fe/Co/Zn/Cd) transporter